MACFFCNPDQGRIIRTYDNFYVILGLGPIAEGYALIVAKDHVLSMADLPVRLLDEYQLVVNELTQAITKIYGSFVILEHGRVPVCDLHDLMQHDKHCFHAHQLFIPSVADIGDNLKNIFGSFIVRQSLFDVITNIPANTEYLIFSKMAGYSIAAFPNIRCPRQFLRLLIAESHGVPERADWSSYMGLDEIDCAYKKYYCYFNAFDRM